MQGIPKYSFQKDILSGSYLRLTSPQSESKESEKEENKIVNLGLSVVIVILLLVIRGQRQLILDSDRSSIIVSSTEPDESSWLILSPPHIEKEAIHPEKSMEDQVEETILEKGSFFLFCYVLLTRSDSLF